MRSEWRTRVKELREIGLQDGDLVSRFRVLPTAEMFGEVPSAQRIVWGPVDGPPTNIYDVLTVLMPGRPDFCVMLVKHTDWEGLKLASDEVDPQYLSTSGVTRVSLKTSSGSVQMLVATPLGDGSYEIELSDGFAVMLRGGSTDRCTDRSWQDYGAAPPN